MSQELTIECEQECYAPGDTIQGTVSWSCSKVPASIKVELKWSTSGRGTTDSGIGTSIEIMTSKSSGSSSFSLDIPKNCPPSYRGSLISILWNVCALADISWAKDPKAQKSLIISNSGEAISPLQEYKNDSK
jgi:hypothetical protein